MSGAIEAMPEDDRRPGSTARRSSAPNPSETAQAIAAIAPALPAEVVEDLRRLLELTLAFPSPAERRENRLGLLLEIVAAGTGEIPLFDEYERVRVTRARETGAQWPAGTTLVRAYGSWIKAVKAAMRLHFKGGQGRVPVSNHHQKFHKPYTRGEVVAALVECHRVIGDWPTQWEYVEWAQLQRRLWREHSGKEDVDKVRRVPSLKQIARLFGSFDRALEVAVS